MIQCKNCASEFDSNFCPNCGQKPIERLGFSNFTEIFLGSMFSFHGTKSLFGTLASLLVNPKKVVFSFIQGKRQVYYNPASLFVIFSGIYFFTTLKISDKDVQAILGQDFLTPLWILCQLFVTATLTFLFFKNRKLNFSEHLVISLYYNSLFFTIYTFCHIILWMLRPENFHYGLYTLLFSGMIFLYFYLRIFNEKIFYTFLKLLFLVPFGLLLPIFLLKLIGLIFGFSLHYIPK